MEPGSSAMSKIAPAGHKAVEQLREPPQGVGAEDQIHLPVGVLDLLRHVGLLGHAAAHADELAGLGPLGVHQRAHVAQHPHLGVLPDGAGVDDNQVGLRLALGELVPHLAEVAPQPLRVGLVLLAAVGVHKGQGRGRPGGEPLVELLAEIPLAVHVRGEIRVVCRFKLVPPKRVFQSQNHITFPVETQAETPFR